MDNRLFSLLIIPDSGGDVKTGSFNFKYIIGFFSSLIAVFFLCLFFIIGYHIKLSQENNYKAVVKTHKEILVGIEHAKNIYNSLSSRLSIVQLNDKAFRNFNRIDILDDAQYSAGIGGHAIIDNSNYASLDEDLRVTFEDLHYGITTLGHRVAVLDTSFKQVQKAVRTNRQIYDNTPSILPTHSIRFTDYYRWRIHPITKRRHFHAAVDLAGYRGQEIYATADGVVIQAKNTYGALGRCVKIKHGYGYNTLYGHLNKIKVKAGQKVKMGDIIGEMGRTGRATGVHIHYAISLNGKSQNPMEYLKKQ